MSFDSGIVDFCIGMAFFYLILTLVSTSINEYFMDRFRSLRAQSLLKGISGLFYDSQLVAKIYTHPLVRGLYRDEALPKALLAKASEGLAQKASGGAREEATAGETNREVKDSFVKDPISACMDPFKEIYSKLPSYMPSRTFATALLDVLCPVDEKGQRQDLRTKIMAYGNERIAGVLLPLIEAGQKEEEKLRQNIEKFFDDTMDRVSGWFSREARRSLIVVAAVVCIMLNADSIMVGKMLWQDKELRASVVDQAQKHKPEITGADKATALPGGSTTKIKETADELSPFPLGWTFPPKWRDCLSQSDWTTWILSKKYKAIQNDPHEVPTETIDIIFKVIGLFFTTLAISMGAPFWTDLLNSFVNLRRTGKVPAKAGKEKK